MVRCTSWKRESILAGTPGATARRTTTCCPSGLSKWYKKNLYLFDFSLACFFFPFCSRLFSNLAFLHVLLSPRTLRSTRSACMRWENSRAARWRSWTMTFPACSPMASPTEWAASSSAAERKCPSLTTKPRVQLKHQVESSKT